MDCFNKDQDLRVDWSGDLYWNIHVIYNFLLLCLSENIHVADTSNVQQKFHDLQRQDIIIDEAGYIDVIWHIRLNKSKNIRLYMSILHSSCMEVYTSARGSLVQIYASYRIEQEFCQILSFSQKKSPSENSYCWLPSAKERA